MNFLHTHLHEPSVVFGVVVTIAVLVVARWLVGR